MRSRRAVDARPVRTVLNSVRRASTAPSMRRLPSSSSSSTMFVTLPASRFVGTFYHRADMLTPHHAADVRRRAHVEHKDGQAVVHAEGEGGGVHHLESPFQGFPVRKTGDEC